MCSACRPVKLGICENSNFFHAKDETCRNWRVPGPSTTGSLYPNDEPAAPPEPTIASLRETISTLQRKLALIFDQSCYSDSLGVEGSSFLTCRWCGGGSGPGGKPAFSHNKGCLLDNDELEKEVAEAILEPLSPDPATNVEEK